MKENIVGGSAAPSDRGWKTTRKPKSYIPVPTGFGFPIIIVFYRSRTGSHDFVGDAKKKKPKLKRLSICHDLYLPAAYIYIYTETSRRKLRVPQINNCTK